MHPSLLPSANDPPQPLPGLETFALFTHLLTRVPDPHPALTNNPALSTILPTAEDHFGRAPETVQSHIRKTRVCIETIGSKTLVWELRTLLETWWTPPRKLGAVLMAIHLGVVVRNPVNLISHHS